MSLIYCKVELKLKWANYYALSAASADSNNIIFLPSKTQNYMFL